MRMPVALCPEQDLITIMGHDVVYHISRHPQSYGSAAQAPRIVVLKAAEAAHHTLTWGWAHW